MGKTWRLAPAPAGRQRTGITKGRKNRGYNPEHNFGHGKEHASEIFCLLNLFAFLAHGIQRLIGDGCRKACDHASRKIDFFWALRCEASRYFHKNWVSLFLAVSGHPPDG
jgi:hypothetical protein